MKAPIQLAMIGALGVLTSVATFAQPSPGDETSSPERPEGRSNRPGLEVRRKVLLEKYDVNKDGKLDDTELTALGKDVFEGKLSPPGRGPRGPDGQRDRGFGQPRRRGPGEPGFCPPDRGEMRGPRTGEMERPRFGPPSRGFAPLDSEEGRNMLDERRRELIKKYDVNGDGKLDSAEREAIGKDIEDGKLPPPPPPLHARPEAPAW